MDKAALFPQYFAAFSASFGVFALGAVIGWTNPAQELITKGEAGFEVSEADYSWIGSLLMLGACLVCIPIGFIIKTIGRKLTMLLMIIPFYLGWSLLFLASNFIMICIARFLLGLAGGSFCVSSPIYNAEIAQKEIRGQLGTFFQLLITGGVLYAYLVGGAQKDYKVLNISCAVLPIIYFILMLFQPESPVYLVSKGKEGLAGEAMQHLRGKAYDFSAELNEIKANNAKANEAKEPIIKALIRPINIKALAISIFLMFAQQMSGINAVIFYSTTIFEKGNTGINSQMSTIVLGVMLFLATFISTAVVDKFGRKILLYISFIFMGISLVLLGYYFFKYDDDAKSVENLGWLPVTSLCIYIITFSVGAGPVPWLFMSEVFSDEVRDVAGSISGTTNWLSAFFVTKFFPILTGSIGTAATLWLFALVCVIAILFTMLILPETKGKTTAEIQAELGG